jgi:hypothetical protein
VEREAGLGCVEYVYLIQGNGIAGKGMVIWMRHHWGTACLWKTTSPNLGPAALFRTFETDMEFCRLQSRGAGSMKHNLTCVVYRIVLSASSICYTTKFGLEHPHAYSQLLAREKLYIDPRPSGSGDLVACHGG